MIRLHFALISVPLLVTAGVVACGSTDGDGADGNVAGGSPGYGGFTGDPAIPGTESYDCSDATGDVPTLELVPIATGFTRPVLVTHAPGDTERLFVVEQGGVIRIISDVEAGTILDEPFLDLGERVTRRGNEQGLLGLAFHPNYVQNGRFYVHYSAGASLDESEEGDTIIEEYIVDPNNSDRAEIGSARRVLHVAQPAENHNGGTITFGPDDLLYIGLGDGGGGGDRFGNGQNLDTLLGKILRIDPDARGDAAYTTPPDNLRGAIWDYGLRNPYRFNFDTCTGDLYIGDVGQDAWEEIDVERGGKGKKNYGWPVMEGLVCYQAESCDRDGLTAPVAVFDRIGGTSVVGGAVYRGSAIPALRGTYFYADTGNRRIWSFTSNGDEISEPVNRSDEILVGVITSIQNGGDGELYFTDFADLGDGGQVLRLEAVSP